MVVPFWKICTLLFICQFVIAEDNALLNKDVTGTPSVLINRRASSGGLSNIAKNVANQGGLDNTDTISYRPVGNEPASAVTHRGFVQPGSNDGFVDTKLKYKSSQQEPRLHDEVDHKQLRDEKGWKIAKDSACANGVAEICRNFPPAKLANNFAVLECLGRDEGTIEVLTAECQNLIWEYKLKLSQDERFAKTAMTACQTDIPKLAECSKLESSTNGELMSCLIQNKDNISDITCRRFVKRMATILFSDYRYVNKFIGHCQGFIKEKGCGRLSPITVQQTQPKNLHNQGAVIHCLMSHHVILPAECKHEILRIAELQSDDFHLDRALFFACRDDREQFCHDVTAGQGRVYQCLFKHKMDEKMSTDCQKTLTVRQRLMQTDVHVSRTFISACIEDIRRLSCKSGSSGVSGGGGADRSADKTMGLFHVLHCLNQADDKQPGDVSPECKGQMRSVQKQLMEDYEITPDIVEKCKTEIHRYCENGVHKGGKTLHCLMRHAQKHATKPKAAAGGGGDNTDEGGDDTNNALSPPAAQDGEAAAFSGECRNSIQWLLEEADAGEDFQVDPAMGEACQASFDTLCSNVKSNMDGMSCLMKHVHHPNMAPECAQTMFEVQYFVARNWKLDRNLYRACHEDAEKKCSAKKNFKEQGPENAPLVMPCLYRQISENGLKEECKFEVLRVMKERAESVALHPEIEKVCIRDLAQHCAETDARSKGHELSCLQEHVDDPKLSEDCRKAISEYTEQEANMPFIDKLAYQACLPMVELFCKDVQEAVNARAGAAASKDDEDDSKDEKDDGDDDDDDGDAINQCLIRHKSEPRMEEKCKCSIEHLQIISMKEVKFSHKFRQACRDSIRSHCSGEGMKEKYHVVTCLSQLMLNSTLQDARHVVSRKCRKQMKFELFQRAEKVELDPELETDCHQDIMRFCKADSGTSLTLECLIKNQESITDVCYKRVLNRERVKAALPDTDQYLLRKCQPMIDMFCKDEPPQNYLRCLNREKDEEHFEGRCRQVVVKRLRQNAKDVRLKPALLKACRRDIRKLCAEQWSLRNVREKHDNPGGKHNIKGAILQCLKTHFVKEKLSVDCRHEVKLLIHEAQRDYLQDPYLVRACKEEIKEHCSKPSDAGRVEECLREQYLTQKTLKEPCSQEVGRVLLEGRSDIHVDPLLYQSCAAELNVHCSDIQLGEGRQMSCLLTVLNEKSRMLNSKCRKALSDRVKMWEYAAKLAPPESAQELLEQISDSPSRNYFISLILIILGMLFLIGVFCGRVTKRIAREIKNR